VDGGFVGDDGGAGDAAVQADTATCGGDTGGCLFGSVSQADGFIVGPTRVVARLYREFPSGSASPIDQQIVAKDLTWAFRGLAPWAHYYVEFEPGFHADSGLSSGALTRVGPLAVSASAGAAVAVTVKPVQLDVFEQAATGDAMQVRTASARLVEVGAGGSAVSIAVGNTSTPMPWTKLGGGTSTDSAYYVQFAVPPPAEPSYEITTSLGGSSTTSWTLLADPPTFTGAITSPPAGAAVPAGQDLTVTWALQPAADYEEVELFQQVQGAWTSVFASPQPDAADIGQETIPGARIAQPGMYLVNVAFTKASCPPTTDGCVHASTVANERLAVQ